MQSYDTMPVRVDCLCQHCGTAFQRIRSQVVLRGSKYCSQECSRRAKTIATERPCAVCGIPFTPKPADVRAGMGRYCSRACYSQGMVTRVDRTCLHCGAAFTIKRSHAEHGAGKYCSRHCKVQARRRVEPAPFDEVAFWAKVQLMANGCWFWTGYRAKSGYGYTSHQRQRVLTHRRAYELVYGPVPDGLYVCHSCDANYPRDDTAYRACCNPAHLEAETQAENLEHMRELGRGRSQARLASSAP